MNTGRFIISQVLDLVHRQTLDRIVKRYEPTLSVRHFGCRQQLTCMVFAQMTSRDGLRDIATCLNAKSDTLYHLGFTEPVAKSTLADANENRDWRIWEDLAKSLMRKARPLYAGEDLGIDLDDTIYALDSTTIDLSLTLFPWADFRQTKAGIKMHTQLDLRGPIPTCINITGARQHDVGWLDSLFFEAGAFYLMDRGYMDFTRLALIAQAGAFFVTRAKTNLQFTRHHSKPVDRFTGLRSDHVGKPALSKSRKSFPVLLRKVRYYDAETCKELIFLTNNGDIVNKILRAGNQHEKEYQVRVDKNIDGTFLRNMSEGVRIDGVTTLPCRVKQTGKHSFNIILVQGLNRQIRKMCEVLGYKVTALQRIRIMGITLGKIAIGKWRYLSEPETESLLTSVSGSMSEVKGKTYKKSIDQGSKKADQPGKKIAKPQKLNPPSPKKTKTDPAPKQDQKKNKVSSYREFRKRGRKK
jgi:pseudouridine synthase